MMLLSSCRLLLGVLALAATTHAVWEIPPPHDTDDSKRDPNWSNRLPFVSVDGSGLLQQEEENRLPQVDFERAPELSNPEIALYSRQLMLPGFGLREQLALTRRARVLIVGAGGLGCPSAVYLAAAGVGHLILVDHDFVEVSNLHRQVFHDYGAAHDRSSSAEEDESTTRDKVLKVESLAQKIRNVNPFCRVTTVAQKLDRELAKRLICSCSASPRRAGPTVHAKTGDEESITSPPSLVLDCTDNEKTRHLINDACALAETGPIPLVYGSAVGWSGQLVVLNYFEDGPCLRCIWPRAEEGDPLVEALRDVNEEGSEEDEEEPQEQEASACGEASARGKSVSSCGHSSGVASGHVAHTAAASGGGGVCDVFGVMGPVPGVIATQACMETIKILTGRSDCVSRKLHLYEALNPDGMRRDMKVKRSRRCVLCNAVRFTEPSSEVEDVDSHRRKLNLLRRRYFGGSGLRRADGSATGRAIAIFPRVPVVENSYDWDTWEYCGLFASASDFFWYDVRPAQQFEVSRPRNAVNLPLSELQELDRRGGQAIRERIGKDLLNRGGRGRGGILVAADHAPSTHVSKEGLLDVVPRPTEHAKFSEDDDKRISKNQSAEKLPKILCICRRGNDSRIATAILRKSGIEAFNLQGGIFRHCKSSGVIV